MSEPLSLTTSWPYPRGIEYKHVFELAEIDHNIPYGLLSRQAWQESRFRADIISGAKPSAAGALGIMQIVPKWHPTVDPLDPIASIRYAAIYDAELYRRYGSWRLALMAYNWGIGNMDSHKAAPVETLEYASEILSDAYDILALHSH